MKFTVQMFAVARDWAGRDHLHVDLPSGATVKQLREQLEILVPQFAQAGKRLAIAVNDEFAGDQFEIQPQDSIAVIPPVSGG